MDLRDRVLNVFRSTLEIEGEIDTDILVYREYEKWSSLAQVTLIIALEEEFDTMLEQDDMLAIRSFANAVDVMQRYGGSIDPT